MKQEHKVIIRGEVPFEPISTGGFLVKRGYSGNFSLRGEIRGRAFGCLFSLVVYASEITPTDPRYVIKLTTNCSSCGALGVEWAADGATCGPCSTWADENTIRAPFYAVQTTSAQLSLGVLPEVTAFFLAVMARDEVGVDFMGRAMAADAAAALVQEFSLAIIKLASYENPGFFDLKLPGIVLRMEGINRRTAHLLDILRGVAPQP